MAAGDVTVLGADQARDWAARAAGGLRRLGARRGDRVVLHAAGSAELVCVALGAAGDGVVPVMINPYLLRHEQDALIRDADPVAVLGADDLRGVLAAAPVELAADPLVRPMHYTSGTSGTPKGVYSGILDVDDAAALITEERELWGFGPGDVYLAASPTYHSAPLRFAIGTLLAGGRVVVLPRFSVDGFASAVDRAAVSTTFVAPSQLQRLFAAGLPFDPAGFRLLAHAGAPCPAPLKERVVEAFPDGSVFEFYGSTECQFTVCSSREWQQRPGTVGRARPGRQLRVDDAGMIWCRPPRHARFTYWRDPAKTAQAWRGDWFTVGDLGRMDGEGYLWIDARRDDLVISGGVNVYPVEVEQALARMPGVREVAVFGVPDERWGQRVCAAVVGEVTPDEVDAFARGALAGYKRPKQVHVVAVLPHSANGKLLRRELVRRYGAGAADGTPR